MQTISQDIYESGEIAREIMIGQNVWPSLGTFVEHIRSVHPELTTETITRLYRRFV